MGHQIKQIRTISQVEIGSDLFFWGNDSRSFSDVSHQDCTDGFTQMGIPRNLREFR